jgi:hypothetical protein
MEEELEQLRRVALKKHNVTIIVFVCFIVGSFVLFYINPIITFVLFFVFMVALIKLFLSSQKATKQFQDLYKKTVVIETFKIIFKDVNFDLDKGISSKIISETKMMDMGDTFYSNDYVSGKYKDIPFESSDIHITETETDSEGHSHTVTLFRGQWYIFDFNKSFKADIQVCQKGFSNSRRGGLFSKTPFKKVELEDIDFNKKFKVYAQNELDAFYVLTPNTIENIKKLLDKVKGKLLLCFINNRLHIGVQSNQDFYEASLYKKVDIASSIEQTKKEISVITDFVDILRLDNDLFKKSKEV